MVNIISGGQTGVDRAALDVAIEHGISYRGWCPKGGWAEDLPDPPGLLAVYPGIREAREEDPRERTERNVRDSDRLIVLADRAGLPVSKGTEYALECAKRHHIPYIILDLDDREAVQRARSWLAAGRGADTLCIAGPRESEAPGVYAKAGHFLRTLFAADTAQRRARESSDGGAL